MIPIHALRVAHLGRQFEVFRCGLCGVALRCPKCGNNACNGTYGTVNGDECEVCPLTYDAQDAHGALLAALEHASGILTEGGDAKRAPGASLSSPTRAAGDAQHG
jgi:hypothetical protein